MGPDSTECVFNDYGFGPGIAGDVDLDGEYDVKALYEEAIYEHEV